MRSSTNKTNKTPSLKGKMKMKIKTSVSFFFFCIYLFSLMANGDVFSPKITHNAAAQGSSFFICSFQRIQPDELSGVFIPDDLLPAVLRGDRNVLGSISEVLITYFTCYQLSSHGSADLHVLRGEAHKLVADGDTDTIIYHAIEFCITSTQSGSIMINIIIVGKMLPTTIMPLTVRNGETSVAKLAPYHHLKRIDQWPSGICWTDDKECKQPIPTYFTLHGLWPSNIAWDPVFCTPPSFDINEITSLVSKLSISWPSLFIRDQKFWEMEWNKHGSCSVFNEYEYFQLAIDLWEEYNITAILESNGIVRGASYPTKNIEKGISSEIGFEPSLICVNKFLTQIQLCLDPLADHYIECRQLSDSCKETTILKA